ncbi:hypothetical protein OZX65_06270 [Leuconostocaceae bacterium ESL0723]|nr:hypothetical protein OZX65_06270 [Leuconostocaceae bacterium ESL0723]
MDTKIAIFIALYVVVVSVTSRRWYHRLPVIKVFRVYRGPITVVVTAAMLTWLLVQPGAGTAGGAPLIFILALLAIGVYHTFRDWSRVKNLQFALNHNDSK